MLPMQGSQQLLFLFLHRFGAVHDKQHGINIHNGILYRFQHMVAEFVFGFVQAGRIHEHHLGFTDGFDAGNAGACGL